LAVPRLCSLRGEARQACARLPNKTCPEMIDSGPAANGLF
jgi:hypothetical protein